VGRAAQPGFNARARVAHLLVLCYRWSQLTMRVPVPLPVLNGEKGELEVEAGGKQAGRESSVKDRREGRAVRVCVRATASECECGRM
jgi:hypothetical protein